MVHDSEHLGTLGEGENIAGYWPPAGPLAQGGGVNGWLDEKKDYHGQPTPTLGSAEWNTYARAGHYAQMVWRDTKEVGCATAYGRGIPYSKEVLGHVASKPNDFMSILVCRYSPAGNIVGQKAY
jgi:Cysteine-rich secretory protein family